MPSKNDNLSSDEESIDNYESQDETLLNETHTDDSNKSTTKNTKLTFEEFINSHIKEFETFKLEFQDITMKDFYKTFNKFLKSQESFMGKLVKMHQKSGSKKKRKHTENTGKSGFNKPSSVPPAFVKYLDIDTDSEMTRPQLVKLLNKKFTDDGFKHNGNVCISSKKTAKLLGVDKDHTFPAKNYHKFIASYYNELKSSNT